MKELLSPLFDAVPFLVEYISSAAEEAEIDLAQARKCCDFKRMMLESVKEGEGVGIPIPIAYDDIQVSVNKHTMCHLSGSVLSVYVAVMSRTWRAGLCCRPSRWTKCTAPPASSLRATPSPISQLH